MSRIVPYGVSVREFEHNSLRVVHSGVGINFPGYEASMVSLFLDGGGDIWCPAGNQDANFADGLLSFGGGPLSWYSDSALVKLLWTYSDLGEIYENGPHTIGTFALPSFATSARAFRLLVLGDITGALSHTRLITPEADYGFRKVLCVNFGWEDGRFVSGANTVSVAAGASAWLTRPDETDDVEFQIFFDPDWIRAGFASAAAFSEIYRRRDAFGLGDTPTIEPWIAIAQTGAVNVVDGADGIAVATLGRM